MNRNTLPGDQEAARLQLPAHLLERIVTLNPVGAMPSGEFILYWTHHALRAHENPALETAATLAVQLKVPLLIYQGLGGKHRYNSDRHHRFILESARDLSGELETVGQKLYFHLPADPAMPGPFGRLIDRSALVVSELYPVPPFTQWYRQHADAHPDLPWLLVDSSAVLPMPGSASRQTRAFQFRNTFQAEIHQRAKAEWPTLTQWPDTFTGDPGFDPFDLDSSFEEAIAACRIDHSIPPVSATRGGSSAGYRRWSDFLQSGLDRYHLLRNDAARPKAVSRMSPYLHYGCVSPLRLAREAMTQGGEGAEKFLDELLTWRELSHHFCFHTDNLETLDALPGWAKESLLAHETDPRDQTFDWERLARGRTGEPLWDLCQQSLVRQGELHNNLRMTWGKSFLHWTQKSQRAQKLMIDLNHRFALDGSDPNSYGGLLWCLGQFDRAFPPGPVFGKVRQRSIARHAQRLDMGRYAQWVSQPPGGRRLRVIVIGAGLSGLAAARTLSDQGHDVVVVEKARGPGGRMSTRRQVEVRFDHGAQYFTARDPRFLRHVLAWRERGLVTSWDARIAAIDNRELKAVDTSLQRYVPVPSMNQICREMVSGLDDCRFGWQAQSLRRNESTWIVTSSDGDIIEGDVLIMTAPPAQAKQLLQDPEVDSALAGLEMRPCWAVMAVLDRPLFANWDAAFVNEGPLSWISSQNSRPQRPEAHAWVLHGSPEWSRANLENDSAEVTERLLDAARALPEVQDFQILDAAAHRWRYALAAEPLNHGALWFESKNLALAGDWCNGSKVEGAFLSGIAAAGRVLGSKLSRGD
jgi:photolyase PhrII